MAHFVTVQNQWQDLHLASHAELSAQMRRGHDVVPHSHARSCHCPSGHRAAHQIGKPVASTGNQAIAKVPMKMASTAGNTATAT